MVKSGGIATVVLSGPMKEVSIGGGCDFVIIGERINPTNRPKLAKSLASGQFDYAVAEAKRQADAGAAIIDVNVGMAGLSESEVLPELVAYLQERIDLPLSLDSASVEALEAAVAVCKGRPLINSTTGEAGRLSALLHLAKSHKAAIVALLMDERGVPGDVDGRLRIADKILNEASKVGLSLGDILLDTVVTSVGASPLSARTTLLSLRTVIEKFEAATVLGVSNVSYGMPGRPLLNQSLLCVAIFEGLSAAIMDPLDKGMRDIAAASWLLSGRDKNAMGYIRYCRRSGPSR